MRYHRVIGLLLNTPLNADPTAAMTMYNALCGRLGTPLGEVPESEHSEIIVARQMHDMPPPRASRFAGDMIKAEDGHWGRNEPFMLTKDGTAIVSVTGELVNRGMHVGSNSGVTSYEGIKYQLSRAAKNPRAKAIVLDIESPGGMAVGNSELAAYVRAINEVKPVYAIANGMAASAAYMMASGARQVIAAPSAVLGSIGTMMIHLDLSEKATKEGIKPTLIYAGEDKASAHPLSPLSEAGEAKLRGVVNSYYQQFLEGVAAGRGRRLSKKAARETEARIFIGASAVEAGLADAVGSFEDVVNEADSKNRRSAARAGSTQTMTHNVLGDEVVSQADHQTAVRDARERTRQEVEAIIPVRIEAAVAAERTRISEIVNHDGVKGMEPLALKMALRFPTATSADVVDMLKDVPKAAAQIPGIAERAAQTGVNAVMAGGGEPGPAQSSQHADGSPKVDWTKTLKQTLPEHRIRN